VGLHGGELRWPALALCAHKKRRLAAELSERFSTVDGFDFEGCKDALQVLSGISVDWEESDNGTEQQVLACIEWLSQQRSQDRSDQVEVVMLGSVLRVPVTGGVVAEVYHRVAEQLATTGFVLTAADDGAPLRLSHPIQSGQLLHRPTSSLLPCLRSLDLSMTDGLGADPDWIGALSRLKTCAPRLEVLDVSMTEMHADAYQSLLGLFQHVQVNTVEELLCGPGAGAVASLVQEYKFTQFGWPQTPLDSVGLAEFAKRGPYPSVSGVKMDGCGTALLADPASMRTLINCFVSAEIRVLHMSHTGLSVDSLEALCGAQLPSLSTLHIQGNSVLHDVRGLGALGRLLQRCQQLGELAIERCGLAATGLAALAGLSPPNLAKLTLGGDPVSLAASEGGGAFRWLLKQWTGLQSVEWSDADVGCDGLRELIGTSPPCLHSIVLRASTKLCDAPERLPLLLSVLGGWERLSSLHLQGAGLTPAVLGGWPAQVFPSVRRLDVGWNRNLLADPHGAQQLFRILDCVPGVSEIVLAGTAVVAESLIEVIRHVAWRNVEILDLGGNATLLSDEAGCAALARVFEVAPRLRELDIWDTGLSVAGASILAMRPSYPVLTALMMGSNTDVLSSEEGCRVLGKWLSRCSSLETLDLSSGLLHPESLLALAEQTVCLNVSCLRMQMSEGLLREHVGGKALRALLVRCPFLETLELWDTGATLDGIAGLVGS